MHMAKFAFALAFLAASPAAAECRFTLVFTHDSARISRSDALLLGDLARAYPAGPFALSAHADDDGSAGGNSRIAEARARAVAARLYSAGAVPGAVTRAYTLSAAWDVVPTLGEASPLNRRVELFVGGCDPRNHLDARPLRGPGVAFRGEDRVRLTSPRLPRG
jgi:hypothetical protein